MRSSLLAASRDMVVVMLRRIARLTENRYRVADMG